ncbi:MAG: hypothetical protein BWY19_00312 [bacterium ADurb.Bin212]|nr:MAG: hypothetical protein BWY19_00312 [bacterium ADurb.Bin212]
MSNLWYIVIASLLMLPGIAGVVLPFLPGLLYMLGITAIYVIIDKFSHLSWTEIIILAFIVLISLFIDYLSGTLAAKIGGASRKSLFYGIIGLIIGTFAIPPFGGILGLAVAIFISEYLEAKNSKKAVKSAVSSLIGTLAGIIINLTLAIIYLILFIIFSL